MCGWGEPTFMANLLRELDTGPAALPKGSEVVMFNRLDTNRQQAMLKVLAYGFKCMPKPHVCSHHELSLEVAALQAGWTHPETCC